MLIYQNAEEVHGQRKFEKPCNIQNMRASATEKSTLQALVT